MRKKLFNTSFKNIYATLYFVRSISQNPMPRMNSFLKGLQFRLPPNGGSKSWTKLTKQRKTEQK